MTSFIWLANELVSLRFASLMMLSCGSSRFTSGSFVSVDESDEVNEEIKSLLVRTEIASFEDFSSDADRDAKWCDVL